MLMVTPFSPDRGWMVTVALVVLEVPLNGNVVVYGGGASSFSIFLTTCPDVSELCARGEFELVAYHYENLVLNWR